MMKPDTTCGPAAKQMHLLGRLLLAGAISILCMAAADADSQSQPGIRASTPADGKVADFALHWFIQLQSGQIDRSQYVAPYSSQLTDSAVEELSRALNEYGASPIGAQVMQNRKIGEQTFYLVKILFPRGDETSLMLGLDAGGKITGVDIMSLAGD